MDSKNHLVFIILFILYSESIAMPLEFGVRAGLGGSAHVPRVRVPDLIPHTPVPIFDPKDDLNLENNIPISASALENKAFNVPDLKAKGNLLGSLPHPDGSQSEFQSTLENKTFTFPDLKGNLLGSLPDPAGRGNEFQSTLENKNFTSPDLKGNLLGSLPDPAGRASEYAPQHLPILPDMSALSNILTRLTSAATLATNSGVQLAGIVSTVSEGAQSISKQVEVLQSLAQELSKEVSKPLEAVKPLVQAQIDLMAKLSSTIEGVVEHVNQISNALLTFQFLIFICLGIGCFTSFLCFVILIILCCNRRATAKSERNIARIESGYVGRPISRHDASLMKDFETENRTDTLTLKTRF